MYLVDIHEGSRYPYGIAWKKNGADMDGLVLLTLVAILVKIGDPEGKLAILHQKRWFLIHKDTENMLAIVSAVRQLWISIDVPSFLGKMR